jgi:hypothetical protein
VHLPESCSYGNGIHKWIFKGKPHSVPYSEKARVAFNSAPGPVKICFYVHVDATTSDEQLLVAETLVDAAGGVHRRAPLTVSNVCSFAPGLGVRNPFKGRSGPGVYWDNDNDGVVDFGALSYEGDNAVDAVFVNDPRGALAWVARCYPRATPWIRYPQYLAEHARQQPRSSQSLESSGGNVFDIDAVNTSGLFGQSQAVKDPSVGDVVNCTDDILTSVVASCPMVYFG